MRPIVGFERVTSRQGKSAKGGKGTEVRREEGQGTEQGWLGSNCTKNAFWAEELCCPDTLVGFERSASR